MERYYFGAVRSLIKWRSTGEGPPYRKFGRNVLYDQADLVAWAESRISGPYASTHQLAEHR
jgi:hypothetical protein